jgi:hypothetical protein
MAYSAVNVLKDLTSQTVAASQTNSVLVGRGPRDCFAIQPAFMRGICIDVVCSAVTVGGGITLKLQTRYSNAQSWVDSVTVAVTAAGTFSLKLLDTIAGDQTYLPLRSEGRVVVTTGAASASVTVDAIYVPQLN